MKENRAHYEGIHKRGGFYAFCLDRLEFVPLGGIDVRGPRGFIVSKGKTVI